MSDAPVAPAVQSLDPVEWTKRINRLEEEVNRLTNENFDLKSQVTKHQNAAAVARGVQKPMKDELEALRAKLSASDNLKELERLRLEVAKLHTERAKREREVAEDERKVKAQINDLNLRAIRAEGKFQALESTAAMMAASRDRANESAAAMLVERDQARKRIEELEIDLKDWVAQFHKQRTELEQAQAELKALRSGKAK